MPPTKHFLLHGLSRLTVRVAHALMEDGVLVTVFRDDGEGRDLLSFLPSAVRVVTTSAERYDHTLIEAGIERADCLLALADDDLSNLRVGVAAQAVAAHVPVVLRTFDPIFADQLETGLNVRRAYSVSALAAPAFIAAASGSDVLETLRLGTGEVPICRLTVRAGSALVGLTAAELKAGHGCSWLARAARNAPWSASVEGQEERPLDEGDQILVGGLLLDVLRLSCRNAGWLPVKRRRQRVFRATRPSTDDNSRQRHLTRLPLVAALLSVVLVAAIVVFGYALKLHPIDALYFVITTATTTGYGDYSLKDSPAWLKLFGCGVMLAGGALFGILFSYLAALTTAERLEEVVGRRARQMEDHIVVAGLGNVGYRVAQYLSDLGLGVVVLEQNPSSRFASSLRVPVLPGDARQTDSLERAAVRQALALIACTSDDLANIQACLHAQRCRPDIVTVARVYDDVLAERLTQTFKITKNLCQKSGLEALRFSADNSGMSQATSEVTVASDKPAALPTIWNVSDDLWETMQRVLAVYDPPPAMGRPRIDQRKALDGIIYRARTGCQWNHLPPEFGDDVSVHRTMQRWESKGVFDILWAVLLTRCEALRGVDWNWQSADCALGKARGAGKRGSRRVAPEGTRPSACVTHRSASARTLRTAPSRGSRGACLSRAEAARLAS